MPETFGFDTYLSPFTTRYGSPRMRQLHSQSEYFGLHRNIWTELARAQMQYGIVSSEELADIEAHKGQEYIDIERIRELDRKIHHDLMAHLKAYAEQCKTGGGKLHLGGTSMDVEDNADIIRAREASDIIITRIANTLDSMLPYIRDYAGSPCVAWTHLQPAGYTTVGYRFANYAQDLLLALRLIEFTRDSMLKGKGMKGIAGTSSSYTELLGDPQKAREMEDLVMGALSIEAFPVATQVYPRIVDYVQLSALGALAAAAHKFALDLRLLSAPFVGEMFKIPKEGKVGSSAAPWKVYNPTEAERINSLARYVAVLPGIAWMNAASNVFERTLDDSANRRIALAEAYLATDQVMIEYDNILRNLGIRAPVVQRNLRNYGTFMKTEPLMMRAVKERGANRQEFHEAVRSHVMQAYEQMLSTGTNPLPQLLANDPCVSQFFSPDEVSAELSVSDLNKELGDAELRSGQFLGEELIPTLKKHRHRLGEHAEPEF